MDFGTRIVRGANALGASPRSSLVMIGNFDGVHRGHRAVLVAGTEMARSRGLSAVVLTFDPHPAEVLAGGQRARLTTVEHKVQLILGLSRALRVVIEPFTRELASLEPSQFAATLLAGDLGARVVIVGEGFRFGAGRRGDLGMLRQLGQTLGFEVQAERLVGDAEGVLSSSRVRAAVANGDLESAAKMLGRPHALSGRVIRGDGRGRTIGVPTANLDPVPEVLPPRGVYSCLVDRIDTGGPTRLGPAVANIGVRPTVGPGSSRVEAHLLDFDGDLYHQHLRVHLLVRQRGEVAFAGLAELSRQIQRDIALARRIIEQATEDGAASPSRL